ncbi:hypothetical protein DITRI_Ditri08aG0045500 [Diplodiscus trichospermus]
MDLDNTKETNGSRPTEREADLHLIPVSPEASGVGLPYASVDWPEKGDVWTWKVGRRVTITGHFLDRYLYPPNRLRPLVNSGRKRGFDSKLSVERSVKAAFPDADIKAFFASFSWKIPAKKHSLTNVARASFLAPPEEISDLSVSDPKYDGLTCKAGNKNCNSLVAESESPSLVLSPCDLCCSEPHFCRDCCCVLCSKTIDLNYGGYSYIKCEAMVDGCICGHVAHLNCALRSYMAGTVGGSIGLDAEYYCRRCDAKTSLVPHVTRLLQTCESIDSRDDIENILNIGFCILRGTEETNARGLLNRIESAITKLKCETSLEDIWEMNESDALAISTGIFHNGNFELKPTNHHESLDSTGPHLGSCSDYRSEYLQLEYEIDHVLLTLRNAQESEYKIAQESFYAQKNHLRNLFQQLDKERSRSELSSRASGTEADVLLSAICNRVDQIKQEVMNLREMEQVANGFGRTPIGTLKKHFGLETKD